MEPNLFEVLGQKKHIVAFSALFAFALSYYLTLLPVTGLSLETYADMNGVGYTAASLLLSAIMSVLFGVWVALLSFKAKPGLSGFIGTIVGAAAIGCPTCGAPLLALVGMPLGLFHLPFWGLELKAISIILISASIWFMPWRKDGCKL